MDKMHRQKRCEVCKGAGYLSAELLARPETVAKIAAVLPDEPVPVQKDVCPQCDGTGRWGLN